ncbi:ATP-dependent DNA helicase 2 subunit 2 isoform 1 [Galdieria sulphuraria]|uniref:ATP-dependent DNA helicase 2 subunit 2 isoform 1 n=1 Tax=Galdieria sulphuraria TaxID=130081 RepID=M2X531_GALSU|nr:ATP-dependent DNA helicase 2 subunit 2 isoform 1 [Galdieria sulphuraria]EME31590.1 ATP-dependent DNA helicase 2 subunit 2 isoform 1 [Galdieria sulphuraria]|eukprot:XP_005708110.1 ATP-dependent DNA helicase 2 subunit 2 isoform 1 [Galdieria sulphuraria]
MIEAIVLVCDIGCTLDAQSLDQLKQVSIAFFLRCLTYGSWRQLFGLVFMGSREPDNHLHNLLGGYTHIKTVVVPERPDISLVKYFYQCQLQGGLSDYIDAICVSSDLLISAVNKKKLQPRIVLITDGKAEQFFTQQVEEILPALKERSIRLDVIGIDDFLEDKMSHSVQISNAALLCRLTDSLDGTALSFKVSMEQLSEPIVKPFSLRTNYSGMLQISSVQFPVRLYTYCRDFKPPTGNRIFWSESMESGKQVLCVKETHYFSVQEDRELEPEEMIEGHFYGRSLIPVSPFDLPALSYGAPKCLKVLGFFAKKDFSQHILMSGVDVMIPDPNDEISITYFVSLTEAMLEMDRVALCRYVRRDNTSPALMLMWPHLKSDGILCLFLCQLPVLEDIRNHTFPSLHSLADNVDMEQVEAIRNWIASRQLKDTFQSTKVFHYYHQRLLQCLQDRAIYQTLHNDEKSSLPPLSPYLERVLENTNFLTCGRDSESTKQLWKYFPLRKVDKPKRRKQRTMNMPSPHEISIEPYLPPNAWSDVNESFEEYTKEEPIEETIFAEKSKVGEATPVADFENMLSNKRHDWLDEAMKQMQDIIERLFSEELDQQRDDKIIHCLTAFRKRCIMEGEELRYNRLLSDIIRKANQGDISIHTIIERKATLFHHLSTSGKEQISSTNYAEKEELEKQLKKLISGLSP